MRCHARRPRSALVDFVSLVDPASIFRRLARVNQERIQLHSRLGSIAESYFCAEYLTQTLPRLSISRIPGRFRARV
jgi:hypothetical protein